jgi:prephenate dehydrogenase
MIICVIGLGLIGGSMAIDLKKRGFCSHVIGVDNNIQHSSKAIKYGIVDKVLPLEPAIKQSDLVLIAIPADATLALLPDVLNVVDDQIVLDVCSNKQSICQQIADHPRRGNFVATHPMAGTEFSGPEAVISGLFDGKATIFCEVEKSKSEALTVVRTLFNKLSMRIIEMSAADHDMHAAYVSHISHISSFALALTVLEKEEDERNIFDMASGGFDSTVRLAKSSSAMWAPILTDNAENIVRVLQTYIDRLVDFKSAIEDRDSVTISEKIREANKIRKVLSATGHHGNQIMDIQTVNKR